VAEPVTDLVEFMRARLDEDEQVALAAAQKSDRAWRYTVIPGEPAGQSLDLSDERVLIVDWTDDDELLPPEAEHIARHDPARVLREVEAKRRILDLHPITTDVITDPEVYVKTERQPFGCRTDHEFYDGETAGFGYCETLKLLALPYADHEEFNEEWRP
jgi:hypothetical protein